MALTKISRSLLDTGVSDSSDATAITIDSSENVLIGTSSSSKNLRLQESFGIASTGALGGMAISGYSGTTAANRPLIDIQRSRGTSDESMTVVASGDYLGSIVFRGADGTNFIDGAEIAARVDGTPSTSDMPTNLTFHTQADGAGGAAAERMRIDSSGRVGIGVTAPTNTFVVGHASHGVAIDFVDSLPSQAGMFTSSSATTAQAYGDLVIKSRTDYSGYGIGFYTASSGGSPLQRMALIDSGALYLYNQNTGAGNADLRYSTSTGAVTYDTSSRLVKDKIEPIPYGLETVLSLSPKKYIRTDSDDEVEVGFIADEIEKVIPELVGMMEKSNFTDNEEDTELIAGSVDYKKLTAVLTKAIQEQQEQIEALQSEINTLKGE
jgi:hypothetical protein